MHGTHEKQKVFSNREFEDYEEDFQDEILINEMVDQKPITCD